MRRDRCGSCGSNILQPFLDLGTTPLADAFPKSPDEWEAFYPLGLVVCQKCWLVQNSYIVPDDRLYNGDYGFYTGASPSGVAYFAEYARWAIERFDPKFVVEIASNDGTLLAEFAAAGVDVVGVEPSANVAKVSLDRDIITYIGPFGRQAATELLWDGRPDLVIANNVVAHVSDLDDFLGGIADLLSPGGTALIEFQYVADLLLGNQFDHVYHEHRSFFSVASLDAALRPHGLVIADYIHTPAQGGSIRAIVRHGKPSAFPAYEPFGLRSPDAYTGFQGRVESIKRGLWRLVDERKKVGPVIGYGATAKSTTLLNYCGFGPSDITFVEDMTPTKIGRYTPGTHIPILSPAEAQMRRIGGERHQTRLLLAWNYLSGILERSQEWRDEAYPGGPGGKFIVPIPMPVLL